MYRVHKRLSKGKTMIEKGAFSMLDWLPESGIAKLTLKGAISKVRAPPLMVLPAWTLRAKRLKPFDIIDAEQFLEADPLDLAEKIGAQERTIHKWRDELMYWLSGETPKP